MTYQVLTKKRIERSLRKLPLHVQQKFEVLKQDLTDMGPVQPGWPNYSKLGENTYHCHLNHSYVACWTCEKKKVIIEVYYVGSREDAPY